MNVLFTLFSIFGALKLAASMLSDGSFDSVMSSPSEEHPILSVYRASHSHGPIESASFASWDGYLPYPSLEAVIFRVFIKSLTIITTVIALHIPEYFGLQRAGIRVFGSLCLALINYWTFSRTYASGSLSSVFLILVILCIIYLKYFIFETPIFIDSSYWTMEEISVTVPEICVDFFLHDVNIDLVSHFNQQIQRGNFYRADLAVDHHRFTALVNKAMTDKRPDVAVSLIEWASGRKEIYEQNQNSFLVSLHSCLLQHELECSTQERLLRVLFAKQTKLALRNLEQCPEVEKWMKLLWALQEIQEIHRKAFMLKDSPEFSFQKNLRHDLVYPLIGYYDRL